MILVDFKFISCKEHSTQVIFFNFIMRHFYCFLITNSFFSSLELRLPSVSDDMIEDEQGLESLATSMMSGLIQGGSTTDIVSDDKNTDVKSHDDEASDDTADDVSIEELDTAVESTGADVINQSETQVKIILLIVIVHDIITIPYF